MMTEVTTHDAHHKSHGHVHDLPTAEVLRERGKRVTAQRAAIWEVLTTAPGLHLSADEVADRVHERMPQVNASTVYRTLDTLAEEGLVSRTDLGAGRSFFEPTHEHRHHHLVCEVCGSVMHVHDSVLGEIRARLLTQDSFELGEREITLFGRCVACAGR